MCGIAGLVTRNPKLNSRAIVQGMLKKIEHRGPDQKGLYSEEFLTLGTVRLSIIDRENHKIPYESEDKAAVIVYNGEIYNHAELRYAYAGKLKYNSNSDAETVLYHYLEKGVDSFSDYNGMYAFAIFDKIKRELYLVRDRAGEKPLYYIYTDEFFAFASEIKALLKIIEPHLNENCLSYEAFEFNVGEETLFKGIYCLMPGDYIIVNAVDLTFKKKSYWKVWDNLISVPDNLKKIEIQLTNLIVDSIQLRTRNCVHKFGTFISGGVDSALIACIARPDYIYTCHYPVSGYDEIYYARLVAKKIKKQLIVINPVSEDFTRTREKIAYHLDTPCTWTSFSLWMLLERASKDIKVVLSGDGADELFSGYHRYHLLNHDEQIKNLKALDSYSYLINRYYGSSVERYARLINRCENRYNGRIKSFLEEAVEFYFSKMKFKHIHSMGACDLYTTMQELLQFSDRINMAFSVENRAPFLDYRLICFAFSIPQKYKIKNGITKWILKRIAKKFIPKEIACRVDKRGFSAPINHWFGWGKSGTYDRSEYKKLVFNDWKKVFKVKEKH
ncbi:MAG: asparagine synthase (glutamine-hydrolyzing) [Candidatus Omnitrophica bacterium]|nr:asparagine synthase (glutamine-hydrolyzing) [Candidatus Omnitrophota bacterium]